MDIKDLLAFSVKHNASDLHLSAGIVPMLRVDGEIAPLSLPEITEAELKQYINQIMSKTQQAEFAQKKEMDFSYELKGTGRFRVNAFMQSRGSALVFRRIPEQLLSLQAMQAPKVFDDFSDYDNGLVLITGPTGSGKSTTLAALIDRMNAQSARHILTIEDPIEFIHQPKKSLINQREIKRDTHSFQHALRAALREDPDVILIGELRDKESVSLALTAAETGHLVFATLHTSSAAKTINRIIDLFSDSEKPMIRSMLSESLRAVVSQRLVKKTHGGRMAAFEVMLANTAIRNLIREDQVAQMYSVMQINGNLGMQTMEQALKKLSDEKINETVPYG